MPTTCRPIGSVVNGSNLFFLLIVNPLAAQLLITRRRDMLDLTRPVINVPWLSAVGETAGVMIYALGHLLMAWALVTLGRNYQLGGSAPRSEDRLVTGDLTGENIFGKFQKGDNNAQRKD